MTKSFLNINYLAEKLPAKESVFPISMCALINEMSNYSNMEIKILPRVEL